MAFSVVPVIIRPADGGNGKKLMYPVPWREFQERLATEEEIRGWYDKYPEAGVAIVTGKISGVTVLDLDTPEAQATMAELIPSDSKVPHVSTPRGGSHLYFQYQQDLVTGVARAPGVDVRNDGGCAVAPPSKGVQGKYKWISNYSLTNIRPSLIPPEVLELLNNTLSIHANSIYYKTQYTHAREGCNEPQPTCNQSSPAATSATRPFGEGQRDEILFHLAHHLVQGKMPIPEVQAHLLLCAGRLCDPPFPPAEALQKVKSAIQRTDRKESLEMVEVQNLILETKGVFSTTFCYQALNATIKSQKSHIRMVLSRMVEEKLIERVKGKAGNYRVIERDCDKINFLSAVTDSLSIRYPFGIHRLVETNPGDVMVFAGSPNAGKTAALLNFVRLNQEGFEVHYFSSEMGESELRKRLSKFDCPLESWRFKPWERSGDFPDVIRPGEKIINVIDYMEVHDEFWAVGGVLADIHKRLKGAVAVVALQKNPGNEVGLGGFRGLEKPRLYVAMDSGRIKIIKGKNWATEENPTGLCKNFKLIGGCKFIESGGWYRPDELPPAQKPKTEVFF